MGLEVPDVPDDYGYGDDCIHCWPAGKTPLYVFVRFWDIETCPGCPTPPNGYTFVCKQDPVVPCRFVGQLTFGGWTWQAIWLCWAKPFEDDISEITITAEGSPCASPFWQEGAPCQQDYDNFYVDCAGIKGGKNGHAHVTVYIDPIIIFLTSHYHLVTAPGVRYEYFAAGMDHAVYRLASKFDHTNVMFLIDKEEIDFE